jgi:hypothetical protein
LITRPARALPPLLKAGAGACLVLSCVVLQGRAGDDSQSAVSAQEPPPGITLGRPQALMHFHQPDAMGLFNIPDMHAALLQRPDKSYWLWITGNVGPVGGAVARLATNDFVHYQNAGPGSADVAQPVFEPSCRTPSAPARGRGRGARGAASSNAPASAACLQNDDADYVGANTVLRAANGRDLLMFYEAGNKTAGTTRISHGWEFNVMALARSKDDGVTWHPEGAVLSGTDPKPVTETAIAQPGISEPGAIVADGFLYMFYQYIANQASAEGASVIQVARAPVSSDGVPGAWRKYYNGDFTEPGLRGKGTAILTTANSGCTRPVQMWPVASSYLNAYVLTYLCNEGWFFSTSTDLLHWTPPTNFMAMTMWRKCSPMDWNFVLVTPGNSAGVIGRTGYVLYAHSDSKGTGCGERFEPHMLWMRPFEFSQTPTLARPPIPSSERPASPRP